MSEDDLTLLDTHSDFASHTLEILNKTNTIVMSGREEDLFKGLLVTEESKDANQVSPDINIGSSESSELDEDQHSIYNLDVQSSSVSLTNPGTQVDNQSPTCRNPSTIKYPGQFGFGAIFIVSSQSNRTRSTEFSDDLNKLYIDMNKWVEVRFSFV